MKPTPIGLSQQYVTALQKHSESGPRVRLEPALQRLDIHDTAGLTRYAISAGITESNVQLTIV